MKYSVRPRLGIWQHCADGIGTTSRAGVHPYLWDHGWNWWLMNGIYGPERPDNTYDLWRLGVRDLLIAGWAWGQVALGSEFVVGHRPAGYPGDSNVTSQPITIRQCEAISGKTTHTNNFVSEIPLWRSRFRELCVYQGCVPFSEGGDPAAHFTEIEAAHCSLAFDSMSVLDYGESSPTKTGVLGLRARKRRVYGESIETNLAALLGWNGVEDGALATLTRADLVVSDPGWQRPGDFGEAIVLLFDNLSVDLRIQRALEYRARGWSAVLQWTPTIITGETFTEAQVLELVREFSSTKTTCYLAAEFSNQNVLTMPRPNVPLMLGWGFNNSWVDQSRRDAVLAILGATGGEVFLDYEEYPYDTDRIESQSADVNYRRSWFTPTGIAGEDSAGYFKANDPGIYAALSAAIDAVTLPAGCSLALDCYPRPGVDFARWALDVKERIALWTTKAGRVTCFVSMHEKPITRTSSLVGVPTFATMVETVLDAGADCALWHNSSALDDAHQPYWDAYLKAAAGGVSNPVKDLPRGRSRLAGRLRG